MDKQSTLLQAAEDLLSLYRKTYTLANGSISSRAPLPGAMAALNAAMRAAAAPPQPPSASDERELPPLPEPFAGFQRNQGWGGTLEQVIPSAIGQEHVIATYTADQMQAYARAALAPSPGVDAAEPCEVNEFSSRICELGTKTCTRQHAAPSPAASADEWMAEAVRLLDAYAAGIGTLLGRIAFASEIAQAKKQSAANRAALLAHLKTRP